MAPKMKLFTVVYVALSLSNSISTTSAGAAIGIDLGTSHISAGVLRDGKVEIIPNSLGSRETPMYLSFGPDGLAIGESGKSQILSSNAWNTVFNMKRFTGTANISLDVDTVQKDLMLVPFETTQHEANTNTRKELEEELAVVTENTTVAVKLTYPPVPGSVTNNKKVQYSFSTEQLYAMVLTMVKTNAEQFLQDKVSTAVISVPSSFTSEQRRSVVVGAHLAGLPSIELVNDATASAVAYGLGKEGERKILVLDVGGGTTDAAVVQLGSKSVRVLASSGSSQLGGEDIDQRIISHLVGAAHQQLGVNVMDNKRAVQKLRHEVQMAKKKLSTIPDTQVSVYGLGLNDDREFSYHLTRDVVNHLISPIVDRCIQHIVEVLVKAKMDPSGIDDIILVGGATRMPTIQERVTELFEGKRPTRVGINPGEAVVYGASIHATALGGGRVFATVADTLSHSLAIQTSPTSQPVMVFKEGTKLPASRVLDLGNTADIPELSTEVTIDMLHQLQLNPLSMDGDSTEWRKFGQFHIRDSGHGGSFKNSMQLKLTVDTSGIFRVTAVDKTIGQPLHVYEADSNPGYHSTEELEHMKSMLDQVWAQEQAIQVQLQSLYELESYLFDIKDKLGSDYSGYVGISVEDRESISRAVREELDWMDSDGHEASPDMHRRSHDRIDGLITPFLKMNDRKPTQSEVPRQQHQHQHHQQHHQQQQHAQQNELYHPHKDVRNFHRQQSSHNGNPYRPEAEQAHQDSRAHQHSSEGRYQEQQSHPSQVDPLYSILRNEDEDAHVKQQRKLAELREYLTDVLRRVENDGTRLSWKARKATLDTLNRGLNWVRYHGHDANVSQIDEAKEILVTQLQNNIRIPGPAHEPQPHFNHHHHHHGNRGFGGSPFGGSPFFGRHRQFRGF
jgi:molecular chaperone DnaK (HSP70)